MIRNSQRILAGVMLAICCMQAAYSQQDRPEFIAIGFDDARYANTPLSFTGWAYRTYDAEVPVLDIDTPIQELLAKVKSDELEIVQNDGAWVIVRDSLPLRDGSGYPVYAYNFEAGRLKHGPDSFGDVFNREAADGFDAHEIKVLRAIADADVPSAYAFNQLGWTYATYADESIRDPGLAVDYAERCNELSDYSTGAYVDTLAAAYAIAGDYERASLQQERAIHLVPNPDMNMRWRLALYQTERPYIEPLELTLSYYQPGESGPSFVEPPRRLVEQANLGNTEAQWDLAVHYLELGNYATPEQLELGAHWLLEAARGGHEWAVSEVGFGYMTGENGFEQDIEEAMHWLTKAAQNGSDLAAINIARLHSGEYEMEANEEVATFWLEQAARLGLSEAIYELAFRYGEGVGAERDLKRKQEYLATLALANYGLDDYVISDGAYVFDMEITALNDYLVGSADTVDVSLARLMEMVDSMESDLRAGEPAGMIRLDDTIVALQPKVAKDLVSKLTHAAARLGMPEAQTRLASYYEEGFIVDASQQRAEYWRERAQRNPSGTE